MKKLIFLLALVAMFLVVRVPKAQAKELGNGWPRYVDTVVTWDGNSADLDIDGSTDSSTWTVWGPKWNPIIGSSAPLYECSDCLDMSTYNFQFSGGTLQFDEIYVPTVTAYPQTHHVVLHDEDGDSVYTGNITARYDFPWEVGEWIRMDVIDYEVKVDGGNVSNFYYVEHEYKKAVELELE